MMQPDPEKDALKRENQMLREKIAALQAELGMTIEPGVALGLTWKEAAVVALLAKRGQATREQVMAALYTARTDKDTPEPKIADVFICKARAKLRRHGITIKTIWGQGWQMDAENRDRLTALCATMTETHDKEAA
jgi:two-component system, cell cycle response regulator CtrA